MQLGAAAPDQIQFKIAAEPAEKTELPVTAAPPKDNFLTEPFRSYPYRSYEIHYRIDADSLHFTQLPNGLYRDDLQIVAVCYRDDGITANSLSTTAHVQVTVDEMPAILARGVTVDQTVAIPVAGNPMPGNFLLRAAVAQPRTGRIGALELRVEWIRVNQ